MTIVWRGFGIAAFFLGLLGALLGVGLGNLFNDGEASLPLIGIGLIVAALATFALGWWLNVIRPEQQAQARIAQRRQELEQLVAAGQFAPVPGGPPASPAEAQAQVEGILERESREGRKRLRNNHALFWVPMQWWGIVFAVLGLLLIVLGVVG